MPLANGLLSAGVLSDIRLEGDAATGRDAAPRAYLVAATPGYFAAAGIALRRGRSFTDDERADSAPVVLVGEELARQLRADGNVVGRRVRVGGSLGADSSWREIVGVVASVHTASVVLAAPATTYLPHAQTAWPSMSVLLRTTGEPLHVLPSARTVIREMDRDRPIYAVRPLSQLVDRALASRRLQSLLLLGFAVTALLLSVLGVYGVLTFAVAQRSRELGLRMALGAQRRNVMALVLGESMARVAVGLALGLVVAAGCSRLLGSLLFEVSPWDAPAFGVALGSLAVAGFCASVVPAWRATRAEPLTSIRRD